MTIARAGRRWLWGHLSVAAVGCIVLMVLFAISMGVTAGQVLGDTGSRVRDLVWAGLAQDPGILLVVAAVAAIICVVPGGALPISWAVLLAAPSASSSPQERRPRRVAATSSFRPRASGDGRATPGAA